VWRSETISNAMYAEMQRIAHGVIARYSGAELAHPCSLIHEAFCKIRRHDSSRWESRKHFLNVARKAMEQVLLDRIKSPSSIRHMRLEHALEVEEKDPILDEMMSFEQAIRELEQRDPRMRQLVTCKAVHRRTDAETAQELGMSIRWVQHKWRFAKAFIGARLGIESRPKAGRRERAKREDHISEPAAAPED
jgi:DNA-directed RNA polymerase specialized sigma24 family protein